MIVTLTVNPSLDRTVALAAPLRPGEVHRAQDVREDAGGKGVNVARVAAAAGIEALAVVPVSTDDPYRALLHATGVRLSAAPAAGFVRENLTITDPEGETTKINLAGAGLSAAERDALIEQVTEASRGAAWLVLAGSLPPGVAEDFYVVVIDAVRRRWGAAAPRIAVDASGPALRRVVESGRPDLVKPNDEELAELVGADPDASGDVVGAAVERARGLVPGRVGAALVTLGADGALLVTADAVLRGRPPRIRVASTVGAGDSSLAGYLIADLRGEDPAARLRSSIAYGAAAASLPGTQPPAPADLPAGPIDVSAVPS